MVFIVDGGNMTGELDLVLKLGSATRILWMMQIFRKRKMQRLKILNT
jgi:hypothetical protein